MWDVIRTLFARRADPYAGNDLDNAGRLNGLVWVICAIVMAVLLPLAPPTGRFVTAGWIVAVPLVASALARGVRWLTRAPSSFNRLLAGSYVAVAELVLIQALAGEGASAYEELYLFLAVSTAAVHPRGGSRHIWARSRSRRCCRSSRKAGPRRPPPTSWSG